MMFKMLENLQRDLSSSTAKQADQHTEVMTAIATLNTQMQSLVGDNQGRVDVLESGVDELKDFKFKVIGYASAIAGLVSAAVAGITEYFFYRKF